MLANHSFWTEQFFRWRWRIPNSKMSIGFTQRILSQSVLFARFAYSCVKTGFLAAREPGKIFDFGMNAVLKLSSTFFMAPFTVTVDQHGVRTLRARPNSRRFLTWAWNIVRGLRIAFFFMHNTRREFQVVYWRTVDCWRKFLLCLFHFCFRSLRSIVFQWHTDDLVFLVNAASRLNKSFSRMLCRTLIFK